VQGVQYHMAGCHYDVVMDDLPAFRPSRLSPVDVSVGLSSSHDSI